MLRRKKGEWDGVDRRAPAKVLVVSDDDGARELLLRVVAANGFEPLGAADGESAMTILHEDVARCVVLDMRAGGIGSNLKVLDMVRGSADERISATRAVIIADNPRNRSFSFQSGTDAFLVRPYRVPELIDHITDVLGRPDVERARHRRDELTRHTEGARSR